jgi:hypothetical protein
MIGFSDPRSQFLRHVESYELQPAIERGSTVSDSELTEFNPGDFEDWLLQEPWFRGVATRLERLSTRHQVCFGLCCAELLLPAYYRTGMHLGKLGEVTLVKTVVSRLWDYATTGSITLDPTGAISELARVDTG